VVATFVRFAETAFACVRSGFGVAIVDAFTAAQPVAGTVVLRLTPSGTLPVYLNRNRFAEQSRVSAAFEEAARRHATLAP
jgi:DNA-binding transcriptional LysR family regulator